MHACTSPSLILLIKRLLLLPLLIFTASRRNEAASWLRKTVGVVAGKELPEQPSEEDFRLGLRSGYILCTAINRVQPGAIPKVRYGLEDSECHMDLTLSML